MLAFPVLWASLVAVLIAFRETLAPFIGAILIAYLLHPLVQQLTHFRVGKRAVTLPRWVGTLAIYVAMLGLISAYVLMAVPKIGAEMGKLVRESERVLHEFTPEKIETYTQQVRSWLEDSGLPVRLSAPRTKGPTSPQQPTLITISLDDIIKESVEGLADWMQGSFFAFIKTGPKFLFKTFRVVLMTFLVLMVAAFLLMNHERTKDFFRSLFPHRFHGGFDEVVEEMDQRLAGVVRGQIFICLINGTLTYVGLLLLGVKFPFLLSTLAAVMSLVPIFGSILSSIPIVAIALTSGLGMGVAALGWIAGIHLLEANFLNPKIIGDAAKVHPAFVVFVLVAGEHFFGVLGALFAVPLTSIGVAFFTVLHRRAITWNEELEQERRQESQPP